MNEIKKIKYKIKDSEIKEINTVDELSILKNFNDIVWLSFEDIFFRDKFDFPLNLKTINIKKCGILDNLGGLPNEIENINITHCNWLSLDHLFINDLTRVETLDLRNNRLKYFPNKMPPNLTEFCISFNNLIKIPDTNCFGPNITTINISNNKIDNLPKWFKELNHENINLIVMPNYKIKYEDYLPYYKTDRPAGVYNIANEPQLDLNFLGVIFTPDVYYFPSDTIKPKTTSENLQNVHSTDIQETFAESVNKLMKIKTIDIKDIRQSVYDYYVTRNLKKPSFGKHVRKFMYEIFNRPTTIETNDQIFIRILNTNLDLGSIVQRCGVTYFEIFKKIWEITETHEHKEEMRKILRDDIFEARGVCFTGKVTKMVNSMSGFIPEINVGYSENEQINNMVIIIMRRAEKDKNINVYDEVKKELDNLKIDEEKQKIWLEAL